MIEARQRSVLSARAKPRPNKSKKLRRNVHYSPDENRYTVTLPSESHTVVLEYTLEFFNGCEVRIFSLPEDKIKKWYWLARIRSYVYFRTYWSDHPTLVLGVLTAGLVVVGAAQFLKLAN